MKVLKVLVIIAGVVFAGIAVGWLGTRTPRGSQPASPGVLESPAAPTVQRIKSPATNKPPAARLAASGGTAAAAPAANAITNWEDKLDEILSSETEDPAKAKQMLEMFPSLPEDGQVEVAQHLSNLVPDEQFGSLTNLLANASLPESVLDILLSDTLNRPNSLKLPALLVAAQNPQNPKASEAKDLLELFLEEDYGNDWTTWQTKVTAWLKDNPD